MAWPGSAAAVRMLTAMAKEKTTSSYGYKFRGKEKKAMLSLRVRQDSLWTRIALLMLLIVGLAGCKTMDQRDMGKFVPPGNRVAIERGGPFEQRFQTNDMTIVYQYQTTGNRLKVWGTIDVRYESINELVYHLYFLDERYTVIGIHDFYSFLNHSDFMKFKDNTRQFHRDFTVPEGAVAFALGYGGETVQNKEADGISFYHFPFE